MQRGNFSYVIDSSFRPFEMQELLTPMLMYKDAYEKTEEAYSALSEKANDFEYLSKTLPEDSQARKIYEGYANDLKAQADDLTRNGLNMGNRRALLDMKRRYSGEIGRLVKARDAMNREQELRRQMNAKDPSMLWAEENFNIDRYLDNNTPNLYGISGTDLYTRGATAGKAASSRIYSAGDGGSTLGGYYRDYVQRMGYTPEQLRRFGNEIMDDFTRQVSVLPELQQAANQILEANGVTENFKDNPNNLRKAQQQVIRGIIDGAVYNEEHKPVRDEAVMNEYQRKTLDMQIQDWKDKRNATYNIDPQTGEVTGYKYLPKGKRINPDGTVDETDTSEDGGEDKETSALSKQLLKLGYKTLADKNGFDVVVGDNRYHYNYAGAIHKSGDKWYAGSLGNIATLDNISKGGSNVQNMFNMYSIAPKTKYGEEHMKVLSLNEVNNRLVNDPTIMSAIEERLQTYALEHQVDPKDLDFELIEIPHENNPEQTGYLVAIKN